MDQLAAMRAFARIVELRSFSRAAQVLQIPKPSLTKLIQNLEAHLATRLLSRTTRRLAVTPDGAAYYERVVRILADIAEMDAGMASAQARPRGTLRVDASSTLAQAVIIPALPDFFARYQEIAVELGASDRLTDLVGENVDCVLRAGTLADSGLIARRIGELGFTTCAAPSYLARHGVPRHPDDLRQGHRVVGYLKQAAAAPPPLRFARDGEDLAVPVPHLLAVNEGGAFVAAAVAGLGIVQAPHYAIEAPLAAGTLRPVLADWLVRPVPLHVVYAPNRHLSARLRVFVDWVAALFVRPAGPTA